MADLLSSALTIGRALVTWYTQNQEAKERCSFLVPSITIIESSLTSIGVARTQKKLDLDEKSLQSLDVAVEQTFMCVRDILVITQLFDGKKKKSFLGKFLFNPASMLEDIAKKRGDLQYCMQMLSICMQTSTFLKSVSPSAPSVATATGVMTPTHAAQAPNDAKSVMTAVLHDSEARAFWMSNFENATSTPYSFFKRKLEVALNNGVSYDAQTSQAIQLNVDPESKEKVLFFVYQKWVNNNSTLRGALAACAQDIVQAPVVVGEVKASVSSEVKSPTATPTPSVAPAAVTPTSTVTPRGPMTPLAADVFAPPPPAAAVTPFKPTIRGAADPENPPADLEFIWSDPNIDKDWNADLVVALETAGRKWLPFDSASEVVSWFTAHPEFLRSPKLRIMSNNRIYNMEADYSTTSASMEICTHLRKKRSLLPVLIYCGYTIDNALKVAAQLRKTKATNDEEVATRYAKGEPIDW